MFIKTAQHPVHYVFGCITHAPLVFAAWALEDFSYKLRWLALYVLSLFTIVTATLGVEGGIFVSVAVVFVTGFMAMPAFMATKGEGPFALRFSEAYGNAILAWHSFFVSFYLFVILFGLTLTLFGIPWTKDAASVLFSCISMIYTAFTMQMASSTVKKFKQWAVPLVAVVSGIGMYAFMQWSSSGF